MTSSEAAGSKRSSEGGNNWGGGKKPRGADQMTLRFLLRSKHAGGIIGKGGETIKRLRTEFNATVTVPDTQTNERVLSIGADKDDCIKVLRGCLPLVHEPPYPVNAGRGGGGEGKEQNDYELDFLVHSSQVGGIIGRAGTRIKEIREQTNAQVKVYQECLADSTERVVAVGGSEDHLIAALEQMLEVMQEQPIKGNITLYDPSYEHSNGGFDNYDGYNNNFNGPPGRGGMGGGGRGGNMGRGGGRGGGMRGGGMGGPGGRGGNFGSQNGGFNGGGNMGNGGGDFTNNFSGGGDFNSFSSQGGQQGEMFGGAANGGGGNFNGGSNGSFNGSGGGNGATSGMPQTTTQVTVPNDMAGAIIGKGGERIRNIRQKCGADVKFSDSDPVKKDRLITISGSQDQIQYAQYLMQQCVRQNYHT